jgi:hypothetical protein
VLDVGPTVLELLGLTAPDDIDGRSLKRLINGAVAHRAIAALGRVPFASESPRAKTDAGTGFIDSSRALKDRMGGLLRRSEPRCSGQETVHKGLVAAILACGLACGSLAKGMTKISYKGYRFPPEFIQQAI